MSMFTWVHDKSYQAASYLCGTQIATYISKTKWVTYTSKTIKYTYHYCSDSYNQAKTAVKFVYKNSPSPYVFINFNQLWEGVSIILERSVVPKLFYSPKTLTVLWQGFYANTRYYIGPVVLYECVARPALQAIPFFEASTLETVMALSASFYFMRRYWRISIDTMIRNATLTKVATEESQLNHVACYCGPGSAAVIRGNIESFFYYFAKIFSAKLAADYFPIIGNLVLMQALGECFLEYTLDLMCTQHRFEEISKYNWRAFGIGAAFVGLTKLYSLGIQYFYNAYFNFLNLTPITKSSHIDNAIFIMLFQYFIVLSLYVERPYHNNEKGIEFFFDGRGVIERRIKQGTKFILKQLKNTKAQNFIMPIFNGINAFPPTTLLKMFLLEKQYRSLDQAKKTEAVELLLKFRGDEIEDFLKWLIWLRGIPLAKRLAFVFEFVPSFFMASDVKKVIEAILQDRLDGIIEALSDFIIVARIKIKIHDEEALKRITNPIDSQQIKKFAEPELVENKPIEQEKSKPKIENFVILEDYFSSPAKKPLESDWVNMSKHPNTLFTANKKKPMSLNNVQQSFQKRKK